MSYFSREKLQVKNHLPLVFGIIIHNSELSYHNLCLHIYFLENHKYHSLITSILEQFREQTMCTCFCETLRIADENVLSRKWLVIAKKIKNVL